jgi:uncharacterized protein (DUF305 family)
MLAAALAAGIGITAAAAQEADQDEHQPAPAAEAAARPVSPAPGRMPMSHGADDGPGAMHGWMEMRRCMGMMEGEDRPGMPGMDDADIAADGTADPVEAAFDAINRRMHRDMMTMPGDSPDLAFTKAMIAHHEGAIDMARVILGFGEDAEIRKLAESVIAAQEAEIAVMEQWLQKQPAE